MDNNSLSTRAGALALYTAGGLFWAFLPYFIGLQMDSGGLSQTQAGSLGSGYLLGFTLASVSALWWVARFNWRGVTIVATVAIIAALYILQDAETYKTSLFSVIVIGFMMGSFWAIYYRIFASTDNPDRNFALGIVISYTVLAAIAFIIGHYVIPANGLSGAALLLSAIIGVLGIAALLIPSRLAEEETQGTLSYRPPPAIILALIGILATGLAFASIWAFAERIGVNAGLTRGVTNPIIAFNLLASAGGSVFATLLGTRLGRRFSLFVGLAVMAAAILALFGATSVWFYAAGFIGLGLGTGFVMPYQMATLAVLDNKGHFVVLIAAAQGLGSAAGPVLGGMAADIAGISALLGVALTTLLLSALVFAIIDLEDTHNLPA